MKHLTASFPKEISNETIEEKSAFGKCGYQQSEIVDKVEFEKDCKEEMSIEEFRAAALQHINNLPWKK